VTVLIALAEIAALLAAVLITWYGGSYLILTVVRWLFPLVGRRHRRDR
jgi:hypothetical protein